MKFPRWMKLDWLFGPSPDEAKRLRLIDIETDRENLKARIEQARRNKKAWLPLWVQLRDLTNEEDRLRGGK